MTTIQFPDISEWTPVPLRGAPVALARATISNVQDTHWNSNVADAAANQIPLYPYCFLNSEKLGVSPEAQAEFAYHVVGKRPTMLDHEPNRGQCATLAEALRWIDHFRSLGGICFLDYMPKWAWGNPAGTNGLGRPDLTPLASRKMLLVASNYTTYSDAGPGWQPYYQGCPVPVVQWQFSSTFTFNGVKVDWNAFKGTVADYQTLIGGTSMATIDDVYQLLRQTNAAANNASTNSWALVQGYDRYSVPYPGDNPDAQREAFDADGITSFKKKLDDILAAVTAPTNITLSDVQLSQLTSQIIAAHPALNDADRPIIETAVRNVLHSA